EGEWRGMEVREGEPQDERDRRGTTYAILVRFNADRDFFERVSRFLPRAVALFGDKVEHIFGRLESAESLVRDAAMQLTWQATGASPTRTAQHGGLQHLNAAALLSMGWFRRG